jgi:hypothetical protein
MTNKEKFKEVFGLEIDDSADCGFFDCSDKLCKDCPVKETKSWWNTEYMPPQSGEWVTMTYDAYVDLLSQTVKAQETRKEMIDEIHLWELELTNCLGQTYKGIFSQKLFEILDRYLPESEG